jgi:retron-type reverse transcriptase
MGWLWTSILLAVVFAVLILVVHLSTRRRRLKVGELARRLGVSEQELRAVEPFYRMAHVRKRSGGDRRLQVPDSDTKAFQRRILRRVLARLRAHEAACGFERRRSIVDNALPHVGQAVVVRMDLVDFFPSTTADRVKAYFSRIGWNEEAAELLTKLTTYEGGLPQGAPTSPRLSNLVNHLLDARLSRLAARRDAVYTRYADDLTFSFTVDRPKRVRGIIQTASRILESYGYTIHRRKKLHVRRQHQRQEVTGLVVNDGVRLPRTTRRWLRAVKHHQKTGRPTTLRPAQLDGWIALEQMVETQASGRRRGPEAGKEL